MKWIKRLLGLIAILILLIVIVGVYLIATFDANQHKERIEAEVEAATGRTLELAGPIELTLFPSLGLRLEEVRLGNAENFGEEPFAEIDVADVAVAVMPLLRGNLEVQRVEADGVRLNLARDADGRTNWDDLGERAEEAREEAVGEEEERTPTESRLAMERIDVAGVSLSNAVVNWDDAMTGMQARLDPFRLQVGRFRPGTETPLELEAVVRAEGGELEEPVELALDLNGLLNIDLLANRYALRRMNANLGIEGAGLPRAIGLSLETDVGLEMAESTTLRLERVTLAMSELRLTGFAELSELDSERPQVRSELRSNTFSLRTVLDDLGFGAPETTDPDALSQVALDIAASGPLDALEFSPFLIGLDDTRLSGSARWNTTGARPLFGFELAGDELNVDRYLPPEAEEARTEDVDDPRDPDEDIVIELPVDSLRALDVEGRLTLDRLQALGLEMRGIELDIEARDGNWNIGPLDASAYDGSLHSRVRVDVREDTPRYAVVADLSDLNIGALLEDFFEDEARLMGTGNLELDISTRGESVNALKGALNGSGSMSFTDGAVRGINIAQVIRRADARLRGREFEEDEPNQTDFSELTGTFNIRDGVVRNDDLRGSSPLLRVRGEGSADLNDDTLDYRVNTTIVGTLEGQDGRELEELSGINLPIRITGPFTDPSFRLDLQSILRERVGDDARERIEGEARERVDEEVEEQRERIEERLERGVRDLFR